MKTIQTVSSVILAMIAGSAALDYATGLPLLFAVFVLVSAVTLSFGATIVVGALVNPIRGPLTLASTRRLPLPAIRPITRPVRIAA